MLCAKEALGGEPGLQAEERWVMRFGKRTQG
jgi:hypothetical protein